MAVSYHGALKTGAVINPINVKLTSTRKIMRRALSALDE
jgi:hypothetical protein